MHPSAMKYGKYFFDTYCSKDFNGKTIADVGAQDVNGSLRGFCPAGAKYIGVDFIDGKGVDVVLTDPYQLPFDDESVDVVACSSVLEHSAMFWLIFIEMLRILKPDGLLYINAPSNGYVHRFPVDCWRFYPDSGKALVQWAETKGYKPVLLESFIGGKHDPDVLDGMWNDLICVFLKNGERHEQFQNRILDGLHDYTNAYRQPLRDDFDGKDTFFSDDFSIIQKLKVDLTEGQRRVNKLETEVNSLNESVAQRDRQINELFESFSWRITRPLRFIKKLFCARE